MWEDNNPLSYDPSSPTSAAFPPYDDPSLSPPASSHSGDTSPPDFAAHAARTPSEHSPDDEARRRGDDADDDDEDSEDEAYRRSRQERGWSSRVEQMLMENKHVPIVITDAGKNHEGSGGFIVYTIRTGDLEVRRRYSEFESLRKNLSLLHPCLIVPPIPEKHHVADYVAAPTSAKENVSIIDHRKRMLGVFLNRCTRMREIRADSVFQRFLDPNASWSEVLHSPPIASLPKQHLRAPPLNPSEPTPAHQYLPIPSASAKLKSSSTPPSSSHGRPDAIPPGQFPPLGNNLTEGDLDPYFNAYEASTRTYEALLIGSVERVNRRILKRLQELSLDYNELGARYNAFSLSEQGDLASAIEKVGQAVDNSYIATEELARVLGSGFAEPLRESAQFAGVVQKVLRYRVLKRVQEETTRDQLAQKRTLLDTLERSEMEARRIEQYLHGSAGGGAASPPTSAGDAGSDGGDRPPARPDDVESIDSMDFPPTHSEGIAAAAPPATHAPRSKSISHRTTPAAVTAAATANAPPAHKKSLSFSSAPSAVSPISGGGGFLAKGFGKLNYAIHGIVDVDPERTRRDNIGKTREQLAHLEEAEKAVERDVQDAGRAVLKDLRRFQREKTGDLKDVMRAYARVHVEWARKNLEGWEEAREEVAKINMK